MTVDTSYNRIQLAIQVPFQLPNSIQNDLLLQKKLSEYYEVKFANKPDQDLSEMEIEIEALVAQAVSKMWKKFFLMLC